MMLPLTFTFRITNGIYSDNETEHGHGGIYFEDEESDSDTHVYITGTTMSNNIARQGTAVHLRGTRLSNDSYISNSTFSNTNSSQDTIVYLAFKSGIM